VLDNDKVVGILTRSDVLAALIDLVRRLQTGKTGGSARGEAGKP